MMSQLSFPLLFAVLVAAGPAPSPCTAAPIGTDVSSTGAAQEPWQQCGGQGWTGGTTCTTGWTCVFSNPWYSQCLQVSSASTLTTNTILSTPLPEYPPKTISTLAAAHRSASSSTAPTSLANTAVSGVTYKTTVTLYGSGDSFGSPNCQTDTAACGFFTSPGFSAAVSQNLYGAEPGAGAGPACGTCWRVTGEKDSSGNPLTNAGTSIVVMVNNLCPAEGNPLCAQNGLSATNQYGANVNFDLCRDSGAAAAFFGSDGVGLAIGTATEVSCSEYLGTIVH